MDKKLSGKNLFRRGAEEQELTILNLNNRERFFGIKVLHAESCEAGIVDLTVKYIFIADPARLHPIIIRACHCKRVMMRCDHAGVCDNSAAKMNHTTVDNRG